MLVSFCFVNLSEYEKNAFLKENVCNKNPENTTPKCHSKMCCMCIRNDPLNGKIGCKNNMCNVDKNRIRSRILKWC